MSILSDLEAPAPTLATRGSRFVALVIDSLIGAALNLALKVLALTVFSVFAFLGLLAFSAVQIILVSTRGQTIGKLILKIAIVDHIDKTPPGFVRAGVIRQAPIILVSMLFPMFAPVYLLLDGAPIFLSPRRCVHDYLAGTIVTNVQAEPVADGQAALTS